MKSINSIYIIILSIGILILSIQNHSYSQSNSQLSKPNSYYYVPKNISHSAYGLLNQGKKLLKRKRYHQAIPYFNRLVRQKTPITDYGLFYLGLSHYKSRNFKNAAYYFHRILTTYQSSRFLSDAIEYYSNCCLKTGQWNKLLLDLKNSKWQTFPAPAKTNCLYYLGYVQQKKNNYSAAIDYYLKALKNQHNLKMTAKIAVRLEKITKKTNRPYHADFLYLGIGFYRLKEYSSAIQVLQKLPSNMHKDAGFKRHYYIALSYLKLKKTSRSQSILKWLIKKYTEPKHFILAAYQYYHTMEKSNLGLALRGYKYITKNYRSPLIASSAKKLVDYYHKTGNDYQKSQYLRYLAYYDHSDKIWTILFSDLNRKKLRSIVTYYPKVIDLLKDQKNKAKFYYWLGSAALKLNLNHQAQQYFTKSYLAYKYNYYSYKSLLFINKYSKAKRLTINFSYLRRIDKQNQQAFFKDAGFLRRYKKSFTPIFAQSKAYTLHRAIYFFEVGNSDLAEKEINHFEQTVHNKEDYYRGLTYYFHTNKLYLRSIRYAFRLVDHLNTSKGHNYIPRDLVKYCFPRHYASIVNKYSREHKLDKYLVFALIREESRFRANARSWVGARGLMQIMPRTGRSLAKQMGIGRFNLYNIDTNIKLGTYYLAQLIKQFGSYSYALASYNGGPGRMRSRLRKGARMGYVLTGEHLIELIGNNETRNYVKKVLRSYFSYLDAYNQID